MLIMGAFRTLPSKRAVSNKNKPCLSVVQCTFSKWRGRKKDQGFAGWNMHLTAPCNEEMAISTYHESMVISRAVYK
jgi:hypothetical protein